MFTIGVIPSSKADALMDKTLGTNCWRSTSRSVPIFSQTISKADSEFIFMYGQDAHPPAAEHPSPPDVPGMIVRPSRMLLDCCFWSTADMASTDTGNTISTCVCVCQRERERERERQTDRQTDRQGRIGCETPERSRIPLFPPDFLKKKGFSRRSLDNTCVLLHALSSFPSFRIYYLDIRRGFFQKPFYLSNDGRDHSRLGSKNKLQPVVYILFN